MRGIWPTDTDGLVEYYDRSNPNPELANNPPLFDLSSWVPDVIVLLFCLLVAIGAAFGGLRAYPARSA